MADSKRTGAPPGRPQSPAAPSGRVLTPPQLFGGSLILLGIGFAAGVLTQSMLAPAASQAPPAAMVAPPAAAVQGLPPGAVSMEARQALDDLRSHLDHEPDDVDARLRLANALFDAGHHAEAIPEYQRVLAVRPGDADVRTDLGVSQRESGQSAQAAASFRQALVDSPRHANAQFNLGVVLAYDLGDKAGAIAAWERFLDLETDPQRQAQVRQALAELRAGRGTGRPGATAP